MVYIKRLPGYFADISTNIVDAIFKMFLTILLIRSLIKNMQRSSIQ